MQIVINVPDTLPPIRIKQRISELENSLREEAEFLTALVKADASRKKHRQAIMQVIHECAALPVIDPRSADALLGYEDSAMGLWGDE